MHQKILLHAAELVAQGWTRGTAARDADGQKVRSTAPQASAWCVVGAVDRALYELLTLDVYDLLGLELDAYDTAPCPLAVLRALRRPLERVLGPTTWRTGMTTSAPTRPRPSSCSGRPPRRSAPAPDPWGSPHHSEPALAPSPSPIGLGCERTRAWEPSSARACEVTA
jgi:hypothetical protein